MKAVVVTVGLVLTILCLGCHDKPTIQVVQVDRISDVPKGEVQTVGPTRAMISLQLEQDYQEEIKPGITLTVRTVRTGFTSIYPEGIQFSDELSQDDGKTISFDCGAVADKIVDRDLVPLIKKECRAVHAVALDFWTRTPPTEFGDDCGRIWKLKQ